MLRVHDVEAEEAIFHRVEASTACAYEFANIPLHRRYSRGELQAEDRRVTDLSVETALLQNDHHLPNNSRSPLLGCLIGATTTLRSWAGSCYLLTLYDWHYEGENEATIRLAGAFRIIFSPASLVRAIRKGAID